jgi:hypothetical protein
VIADIAGNGVSAGLFIRDEASLERILKKTNQIIYELTDDERFAFSFTRPTILLRAISYIK